jgi:diguanylate cyclase (GGDEF)-like protein/PAS domain S-box-containing protein
VSVREDRYNLGAADLDRDEHLERVCLRNLLAVASEAIYFKDRQSRFILVSMGVAEHHADRERKSGEGNGTPPDQGFFVGKSDFDLFEPSLASEWVEEERRIMETGVPMVDVLERDNPSDATGGWFRTSKGPLRDDDGTVIGTYGITRDVTAQVTAERELARREAQLRAVLDSSPDAITCYNQDLRYELVNRRAADLLGCKPEEVVGRTDTELGRGPEVLEPLVNGLELVLRTGQMQEGEWAVHTGGTTTWWHTRMVPQFGADGTVAGVIAVARDLTELKAAQRVLEAQARRDPLTGLANRLVLMDRLGDALSGLQRNPGRIAVLFIDLDNFKLINDAWGHDVGDTLLVEAASRLSRATRRADTVARLGGDEFVVLLDRLPATEDPRALAGRVLRSLARRQMFRGEPCSLSASIGVAVTDDPQARATDLLREADRAMYHAKANGRNRVELFHPGLHDGRARRERRPQVVAMAAPPTCPTPG